MTASPKPGFAPTKETYIAGFTLVAIVLHVVLRYAAHLPALAYNPPLFLALLVGGIPMVWELLKKIAKLQFGSDLLAGISIITAIVLREYLVATIVVLMLSGGEALEEFATARASSVLDALARRVPSTAHRKERGQLVEVKLADIRIGDELTVLPHEICPVDGVVVEGHGVMDEAYLTGEPYEISKTPGSQVISGAINGETLLIIRTEKLAKDSRYARIMKVMQETEQQRPQLRRLGDQLGAWYTPARLRGGHRRRAAQRKFRTLSFRGGDCHALPVAARHSHRDHWRDLAGRAPRHHHQESRGARTDRQMPNPDFR